MYAHTACLDRRSNSIPLGVSWAWTAIGALKKVFIALNIHEGPWEIEFLHWRHCGANLCLGAITGVTAAGGSLGHAIIFTVAFSPPGYGPYHELANMPC